MKSNKKDESILLNKLDPEFKRSFQSYCNLKGITMREGILRGMALIMRGTSWSKKGE